VTLEEKDRKDQRRDAPIQRAVAILWPSFLTAGIATSVSFALFDPAIHLPEFERIAVYSTVFLLLWLCCAVACFGALYTAGPVPGPSGQRGDVS